MSTDASEEHVATIFGVEEYAKQETDLNQVASRGTEEGGDIFLRNVGWLSTDYTALYPTLVVWKCLRCE
jgi:hypothetical protein